MINLPPTHEALSFTGGDEDAVFMRPGAVETLGQTGSEPWPSPGWGEVVAGMLCGSKRGVIKIASEPVWLAVGAAAAGFPVVRIVKVQYRLLYLTCLLDYLRGDGGTGDPVPGVRRSDDRNGFPTHGTEEAEDKIELPLGLHGGQSFNACHVRM